MLLLHMVTIITDRRDGLSGLSAYGIAMNREKMHVVACTCSVGWLVNQMAIFSQARTNNRFHLTYLLMLQLRPELYLYALAVTQPDSVDKAQS